MKTKRRWSEGLVGRLTAQCQRRKAALKSAGITAITISKSGVSESRRMNLEEAGAKRILPVVVWESRIVEHTGLTKAEARRLLIEICEKRFIFPACFIIEGKPFWSVEQERKLFTLARCYKRYGADDDAFLKSAQVRVFQQLLRKEAKQTSLSTNKGKDNNHVS